MIFFYCLEPFRVLVRFRRFGETYCLHLQGSSVYLRVYMAPELRRTINLKLHANMPTFPSRLGTTATLEHDTAFLLFHLDNSNL
jgi:hypothetical protein